METSNRLRISLAQINPTVGDVAGNTALIEAAYFAAAADNADLVVVPEMAVSGYPAEDLLLHEGFLEAAKQAVIRLTALTQHHKTALLVGTPWRDEALPLPDVDGRESKALSGHTAKPLAFNAALLLDGGAITHAITKRNLTNYRVFDEFRTLSYGEGGGTIPFRGHRLGVLICADVWFADMAEAMVRGVGNYGAEILISPNGSPYETHKHASRAAMASARVAETGVPLVYVNQVGGQDGLVFDGSSFVWDRDGLKAQLPCFAVAQRSVDFVKTEAGFEVALKAAESLPIAHTDDLSMVYRTLVLGLRDYAGKNGFTKVLLGLSGGIDSALTAVIAADALGTENVWGVRMPSPYSSDHSLEDAAALAQNLGMRFSTIPIQSGMEAFAGMLKDEFSGVKADLTEENIQARLRGVTLMALSNKFGHLLLTTGNKSETAVGYATLYGDMCGGLGVLGDVYKTVVYALSHWRNGLSSGDMAAYGLQGGAGAMIPESTLTKPPSAELRLNQTDQDSLPDYDTLDEILACLIEDDMGINSVIAKGFDAEVVEKVAKMLRLAEYKRRQAALNVKITRKALRTERRYPITNGYRGL